MKKNPRAKIMRIGGEGHDHGRIRLKETPRHREAFEVYFQCRNTSEVARQFGVTPTAVNHWAIAFAWDERAEARALEAVRRTETAAIEELQKRLDDHRRAGELLRRRGVEHLAKQPIETTRDAITAIKVGIELERLSVGLPDWVFEILRMDDEQLEKERIALARLAASGSFDQPALPDATDAPIDTEWTEESEGSEPG